MAGCQGSWARHLGNGTLRMAVKVAVALFLIGGAWGSLWAKVDGIEKRVDLLYSVIMRGTDSGSGQHTADTSTSPRLAGIDWGR